MLTNCPLHEFVPLDALLGELPIVARRKKEEKRERNQVETPHFSRTRRNRGRTLSLQHTNRKTTSQEKATRTTRTRNNITSTMSRSSINRNTMPVGQADRDRIYGFRNKYYYSPRYSDDNFEYRHVALPREMLKVIPQDFFAQDGTFKILCEEEWRSDLGITQSLGWVHYACHTPEPHILLFRKPKN